MTAANTVGEYLRARRELVDPKEVGLRVAGVRRTPGLRWARHDVNALAGAAVRMCHPELSELALGREKLPIGNSGGQLLVIYHAAPGSDSARALSRLVPAEVAGPAEIPDARITEINHEHAW